MILLHRPKHDDPFSDKIEERLEEMVVSHKVQHYPEDTSKELPFLQENERLVAGEEQIKKFLQELGNELREQRMVSGDSCYIDPRTGKIC